MSSAEHYRPMNATSGWLRAVGILALAGLAFLLGCFEMGDFDVWWHLRTGELIPERGVPLSDWFSFTAADNAWIDVQWGFQVCAAWVHTKFGIAGLILAKSAVASLVILFAWSAGRGHWPLILRVLVWIPALLLMSSRFFPRPEMITLVFTAIFLSVLYHAERRPILLWLLPMVQVLWANFHGLFVFGPILVAMYWTQAILRLDKVRGLFRHLVPVTLLVLGACIVSPYRIANVELLRELWLKMGSDGQVYRDNISELVDLQTFWRAGGAGNAYVWLLVGLLGLGAFSLLVAWRDILIERRLFQVLPLIAFGFLAFQATRNGNHFALIAGIVIGWNLCSPRWTAKLGSRTLDAFAVGLLLLTLYAVASGRWYLLVGEGRQIGLEVKPHHYSLESMALAGREGMPDRAVLFHLGHASTYIYANGPERKVFMDARLELHSQQEFRDYVALRDWMSSGSGPWQQTLAQNRIDIVFADSPQSASIQATLFSDAAWEPIWFDEAMAVFLRRGRPLPPGIEPFEIREELFAKPRSLEQPMPGPTPPPSWWFVVPAELSPSDADAKSAAYLRLGTALAGRLSGPPVTREAALWLAATHALDATMRRPWNGETFRAYGVSLSILAGNPSHISHESMEAWVADELISSMAAASLRKALACDPQDFSASYYLAEMLHAMGATDWSLEISRHMLARPPRNRAQAQVLSALPAQIRARQDMQSDIDPSSEPSLTLARQSGHLGEHLTRAAQSQSSLSPPAHDELGLTFLRAGLVRNARTTFERSDVQEMLGVEAVQLRIGCVALVDGDFPAAGERFRLATNGPTAAAAHYGLALLSLLQGNKADFIDQVEKGLAANPNAALRERFLRLRSLVSSPSR